MPSKRSKYRQSIFDITAENFGNLDNLIKVSKDNELSISDNLDTGVELLIDNEDLGEADIKQNIIDNNFQFNNLYEPLLEGWILQTGFWRDNGIWIDTEIWID